VGGGDKPRAGGGYQAHLTGSAEKEEKKVLEGEPR